MSDETAPASESGAFKDWFNAARYRAIADQLATHAPGFDRSRFLALTLEGLEQRELMDRLRQTAIAAHAALSGPFRQNIAALRHAAEQSGSESGFVGLWFSEYVGRFGLDDAEAALPALAYFTQLGSAEFAVRGFIERDQTATLAVMTAWADDANEHVRRLASEGSRPRLPWGRRLNGLIAEPTATVPILEKLKADPALYVRKSVANHLNDIAKDHPEFVLDRVEAWDRTDPHTAWIVKHALRTLIKQGHPRALALMGAETKPAVAINTFSVTPSQIELGDRVTIRTKIASQSRSPQSLIVDYVLHYVKASGGTSAKVFKWRNLALAGGAEIELTKSQQVRDFSTRRHYAGLHRVELQVNGQRLAETAFNLVIGRR